MPIKIVYLRNSGIVGEPRPDVGKAAGVVNALNRPDLRPINYCTYMDSPFAACLERAVVTAGSSRCGCQ